MNKNGYIKGALIISLGGFLSKLLGALYRIPLIACLGGKGMGIYQLAYPMYGILLTLSASGLPTGIAKIVASLGRGAEKRAFFLYGGIGLIGSAVLFVAAEPLAAAQGEAGVALCCKLLSPSVFFVSVIAVVRGYFQGLGDMLPTAFTEVSEQAIKVCAGVILAGYYHADAARAAAAAVFAVTISEALCCVFSVSLYAFSRHSVKPLFFVPQIKNISVFSYTLPLTFSSLALPVGQLIESMVVVNVLRQSTAEATGLYGIFSGCAVTVINLPVSISYGLAAASVPEIAPLSVKGDMRGASAKAKKALFYTVLISAPMAVAVFFFSPLAVKIIFPSLSAGDSSLLVKLIKIMSVNAITSSVVQTSSACITSLGKPIYNLAAQWLTAFVRVALSAALVATRLSIYGAAVSANICYFVAVILNLCYIVVIEKNKGRKNGNNFNRLGSKQRGLNALG